MAPPHPKPREQLAKAALAASEWHFSTKPMSAKQREAARKNYEYTRKRLTQTGGALTAAERKIGEAHRDERRTRVPPPVRLGGDARDRASVAQDRNLRRGAAATGGMGAAERARAVKAFETKNPAALLKELKRQGFAAPTTPKQASAQTRQLIRSLNQSERVAIDRAAKRPLDVKRNSKLLGRDQALKLAEHVRNAPPPKPGGWAGKTLGWADAITPDVAQRGFGVADKAVMGFAPPGMRPAMRNVKELTAGVAMAIPAIGETIYKDVTGPREERGNLMWGMAKEMGKGWAQGIERATPIPQEFSMKAFTKKERVKDYRRMQKEWEERPAEALLNVVPAATAAARAATFPMLVARIARANPSFSKAMVIAAARKESYRPGYGAVQLARGKGQGWEGGIPTRILHGAVTDPHTGKVLKRTDPETGEVTEETFRALARPPSRSPLGRGIQRGYDKWSRGELGYVPAKFNELSRAAKARAKGRILDIEAQRVNVLQEASVIEKYIRRGSLTDKAKNVIFGRLAENRARMAETYWGVQGPSGVDAFETIRAVSEDLKDIAREGGQKGGIPTDELERINKALRNVDYRLENLGPAIDLTSGAWAEATNLMREVGQPQQLIDDQLEIASHRARVWAKAKPGRDPNDWINSPEGRDIMGFAHGVPPPEALTQSLFQVLYPKDSEIKPARGNKHRENRLAEAEQMAEFKAKQAAGEIPEDANFYTDYFDPPHKPQYTLSQGSKKSGLNQRMAQALDENVDVETGEMLPEGNPKEYAELKPLLPRDAKQRELVDSDGTVHTGRVTLDQKDGNAEMFFDSLETDVQRQFADWYERVWDYVAHIYGENVMHEMGDAFFASQAAQSPAGGIANLFRTADKISRGEQMPTGSSQWLQRNIWKLMTGEHLGEDPAGLAAKLMDFMDSGLGFRMRTIMQGLSDRGPGVVDRWTWRSDGYYPKPNAEEGGDMVGRSIEGDWKHDEFLGTAKGQAVAYEYSSKRLQLLTDRWNERGVGQKHDWTVEQIQAIDWFATKKRWVEEGFTPKSAEGGSPLDMALDNTREVVFHGTPDELRKLVNEAGGGVRIFPGRKGGRKARFSVSEGGVTHAILAGSGGALDRFRLKAGETGKVATFRYPGAMGGTKTLRSHQFDFPAHREGQAAEVVRKAAFKEKDAPTLYEMGEGVYRLDFGHGKVAEERAKLIAEKMGIDESEVKARFTENAGTPEDIRRDYRRLESEIRAAKRKVKADTEKAQKKLEEKVRKRGRPATKAEIARTKKKLDDATMERIEFLGSIKERLGLSNRHRPSDDQILELANEMVKESRGKHRVLHQRRGQGVAGAVQFLDTDSGKQLLYMSEHANPSTFIHEMFGHAAYEMKREYPADWAKVEKRYKKPLEEWTDAEHEKFATEVERYMMTGKAPVPELQPTFTRMKAWMYTVYQTIKLLGRGKINPETKALLDRYFGKEPLDFTPPKRLRRGLPDPTDPVAVGALVNDTSDLLIRGAAILQGDPAAVKRIAGNMKWLEEQVLPYVANLDPKLAAKVTDLFEEFEVVKSGASIFSGDEQRLLTQRGRLLGQKHAQLSKMADALNAQPNAELIERFDRIAADLESGATLEDQAKAFKALKPILKEVGKRTQYDNESAKLLERQIRNIENALDPDRKVDKGKRDEVIVTLQAMGEQMDDMFLKAYAEGLHGDELELFKRSMADRSNIIPNRLRGLGLLAEGTGPGTYMPHYSIYDKLTNQFRGAVRLPAGGVNRKHLTTKVKVEGTTFGKGKNKLINYGTGQLQVDPRVMISAYKNRMRFLETSYLRDELFKMAVDIPLDGAGHPRVPDGWYTINNSKKQIPHSIKHIMGMSDDQLDELAAMGEDVSTLLKTDGGTMKMLNEWKETWLTKDETEKLSSEWADDLRSGQVKMLPPEVVETLVGKVFEAPPGGGWQAALGLLNVAGRVATIFSHPLGYVGANAAANSMLLGLTNPSKMPRAISEFFRTPWSLRANDFNTYQDIATHMGDFMAGAGIPDFYVGKQGKMEGAERIATTGASHWAGVLGRLGDQPFRVAAWTGHARKYGFNTPKQWRELLDSTDPELVNLRHTISQRAREDMLDFNKLSAKEQHLARYFFIWPFIRAAVAQPFWMLREYPGRIAAVTQVAGAQQRAYEKEGIGKQSVLSKYNEIAPAGERSMFDLSEVPFAGGSLNMGSVNPLGPLAEKMADVNTVLNDPKQIGNVAAGMFNPAFSSLGAGSFGYGGMDWQKIAASTIPFASFAQAAVSPKKRGAQKYTDRDSLWDYIRRREFRFSTETVNPDTIRESGKKEADKQDTRPSWEKAEEKDDKDVEKILAHIRKKGGNVGPKSEAKIKKSVEYYHKLDQAEDAMKEKLGFTELTENQKLAATMEVAKEFDPSLSRLPSVEETSHWSAKRQKELRYDLRDAIQYWRSQFLSDGREMKVIK